MWAQLHGRKKKAKSLYYHIVTYSLCLSVLSLSPLLSPLSSLFLLFSLFLSLSAQLLEIFWNVQVTHFPPNDKRIQCEFAFVNSDERFCHSSLMRQEYKEGIHSAGSLDALMIRRWGQRHLSSILISYSILSSVTSELGCYWQCLLE